MKKLLISNIQKWRVLLTVSIFYNVRFNFEFIKKLLDEIFSRCGWTKRHLENWKSIQIIFLSQKGINDTAFRTTGSTITGAYS